MPPRVMLPYLKFCCCCIPVAKGGTVLGIILALRGMLSIFDLATDSVTYYHLVSGPRFLYPIFDILLGMCGLIGVFAFTEPKYPSQKRRNLLHYLSRVVLLMSLLALVLGLTNLGRGQASRDDWIASCAAKRIADTSDEGLFPKAKGSPASADLLATATYKCAELWKAAMFDFGILVVFGWLISTYFALCLDSHRRYLDSFTIPEYPLPRYVPASAPQAEVTKPEPYYASPYPSSAPCVPKPHPYSRSFSEHSEPESPPPVYIGPPAYAEGRDGKI